MAALGEPHTLSNDNSAKIQENTPTKKVGYDPAADLKKGICGYEKCKRKVLPPSDGNGPSIACEEHATTYKTAFQYLKPDDCQIIFSTEVEFGACFDRVHQQIHFDAEKTAPEGTVNKYADHYAEVGRTYGAYNMSDRFFIPQS